MHVVRHRTFLWRRRLFQQLSREHTCFRMAPLGSSGTTAWPSTSRFHGRRGDTVRSTAPVLPHRCCCSQNNKLGHCDPGRVQLPGATSFKVCTRSTSYASAQRAMVPGRPLSPGAPVSHCGGCSSCCSPYSCSSSRGTSQSRGTHARATRCSGGRRVPIAQHHVRQCVWGSESAVTCGSVVHTTHHDAAQAFPQTRASRNPGTAPT